MAHTDNGASSKPKLVFELEVVEAPQVPTPDQLRSILDFVGEKKVGSILKGAGSMRDAMKALDMAGPDISDRVIRPILVDWNNGRAGEFALVSLGPA